MEIEYMIYFILPKIPMKKYENKNMPTLGEVRGKIVIFSRSEFNYEKYDINDAPLGFLRNISKGRDCDGSKFEEDECTPHIIGNLRYQDNFSTSYRI
jgi:hypothetical protein